MRLLDAKVPTTVVEEDVDVNRMDGLLLIDKPVTWTSHDVVGYLRGVTRIKAIGHAGTLDPFATGLLVLGIGRGTKVLEAVGHGEKTYQATVQFGATSDTDDCTGAIVKKENAPLVSEEALRVLLPRFLGEISQIPPMYAAKKVGGKKLYDLARAGIVVERKPNLVTIHEIALDAFDASEQRATLTIRCGRGTYIRALARDLGDLLGAGAYLADLRRTRIDPYDVSDAIDPRTLDKKTWTDRLLALPERV